MITIFQYIKVCFTNERDNLFSHGGYNEKERIEIAAWQTWVRYWELLSLSKDIKHWNRLTREIVQSPLQGSKMA